MERGQCLETADVDISWQHPGVLILFYVFLFFHDPVCPHVHWQRCVATVCASMGASVRRDLPSFVIVLQGSTDPAASMVSRNILAVFHIQNLFSYLLFVYFSFCALFFSLICPLFIICHSSNFSSLGRYLQHFSHFHHCQWMLRTV